MVLLLSDPLDSAPVDDAASVFGAVAAFGSNGLVLVLLSMFHHESIFVVRQQEKRRNEECEDHWC